jgi:hypothetical protein
LLENLYSITGKVHPSPADPQVSSIALDVADPAKSPLRYYALRIRLEGMQLTLVNIMKPLIDAIVSALHAFPGQIPDLVVQRLAQATGLEANNVRRRLADDRQAVLGARPQLIRSTAKGIAWTV